MFRKSLRKSHTGHTRILSQRPQRGGGSSLGCGGGHHAICFVVGVLVGVLCCWFLSQETCGDFSVQDRVSDNQHGTNNDENNKNLPNHIDGTMFAAHVQSLNDALKPGRGYQPSKERYNSMLPEAKGSYWWLNNCGTASVPEAFGVAALNMTYPKDYFSGGGHPGSNTKETAIYHKYIHRYAGLLLGREPKSLVEFGNGGGVFGERFMRTYGPNYVSVEGSGEGVEITRQLGIPKDQVVQHDLRHPIYLGRRFDVAVCTEVVEHVEPPFAAQIILSLVVHADIVWFSFKQVGLQNGAWINHPNERPFEMWRNLFDFYGYNVIKFDGRMVRASYYRGDFIAYKREGGLKHVTEEMLLANTDNDVLEY